MLTLCTCKHRLRTYLDVADWRGVWLAGFTGVGEGDGRNALVSLTRVAQAFASHADLWHSRAVPAATKRAEAAHRSVFGDLFQPHDRPGDPFAPRRYLWPRDDHVHAPGAGWHRDISDTGMRGRHAALLIGDTERTCLWHRPMVYAPSPIGRGQPKDDLRHWLNSLATATLA